MSDHPEQYHYDQATVSSNGASSLPGILPVDDNAPPAVVAQSAPVADSSAPGAASVAHIGNAIEEVERAELVSELRGLVLTMSLDELRKMAHYAARLQADRKQEVLFA